MPSIATNVAANSSLFYLNRNSDLQAQSLSKISSGSRIVRASDDAAGSALSQGIQSDITSLEVAAQTVQQVDALLQIADGGLQRVGEILQRMKALGTQANSGTIAAGSAEEGFINSELTRLNDEIALIAASTQFNGDGLIDGGFNLAAVVGVALNQNIQVDLTTVDVSGGAVGEAGVTATIIADLDADIAAIGTDRATVGALQSAIGFQGEVVATQIENLQAAKSAIADVDIAAEQTRFTNFQVLTEAAIAGLAQANQITQSLLSLLR
jgi:flagellin